MTTDDLLQKMRSVHQIFDSWYAYTLVGNARGVGSTPREAMEKALLVEQPEEVDPFS